MKYREGFKYQLAEDERFTVPVYPNEDIESEFISLTSEGILTVLKGYAWDGCSGPTKDTPSNMRAGLAHDALYQLMREEKIQEIWRLAADGVLRDIFIADVNEIYTSKFMLKCGEFRAKRFYDAVRKFADFAADPTNKKEIHIAP